MTDCSHSRQRAFMPARGVGSSLSLGSILPEAIEAVGDLRLRMPYGTKISLAADAESPGLGPPEMT